MDSHKIDYEKTISKGRLVFKSFFQEYEPVSSYVVSPIALAVYTRYILGITDYSAVNDKFFAFGILPMLWAGVLFLTYRKTKERKLHQISTPANRELTKQHLKHVLHARGWVIEYDTENYLVANTGSSLFAPGEQMTIIYGDGYLLINVIKNYMRGRMPSILGYKKLAINIEKELQELILHPSS